MKFEQELINPAQQIESGIRRMFGMHAIAFHYTLKRDDRVYGLFETQAAAEAERTHFVTEAGKNVDDANAWRSAPIAEIQEGQRYRRPGTGVYVHGHNDGTHN